LINAAAACAQVAVGETGPDTTDDGVDDDDCDKVCHE
jgi:hypothetical protein